MWASNRACSSQSACKLRNEKGKNGQWVNNTVQCAAYKHACTEAVWKRQAGYGNQRSTKCYHLLWTLVFLRALVSTSHLQDTQGNYYAIKGITIPRKKLDQIKIRSDKGNNYLKVMLNDINSRMFNVSLCFAWPPF